MYNLFNVVEFDDYAEIVDDDPDYAHPMAGTPMKSKILLWYMYM